MNINMDDNNNDEDILINSINNISITPTTRKQYIYDCLNNNVSLKEFYNFVEMRWRNIYNYNWNDPGFIDYITEPQSVIFFKNSYMNYINYNNIEYNIVENFLYVVNLFAKNHKYTWHEDIKTFIKKNYDNTYLYFDIYNGTWNNF